MIPEPFEGVGTVLLRNGDELPDTLYRVSGGSHRPGDTADPIDSTLGVVELRPVNRTLVSDWQNDPSEAAGMILMREDGTQLQLDFTSADGRSGVVFATIARSHG